jgi:predicted DNA-binding protein with PD1-like motif
MIKAIAEQDGFIRLIDGEDLVAALRRVPADAAVILCGIGMVRDVEFGYWDGTAYVATPVAEPVELLSLQGNIARHGAARAIHAHLCIAGADGMARGGHLIAATVHNTAEVALRFPPGIVLERIEEETGLLGLRPSLRSPDGVAD